MQAIHDRLAPLRKAAGSRLKAMRLAAGSALTQRQLGDMAGCSTVLIKKIEGGQAKLTNDLAQRISLSTGVCPFWLQYGIDGVHLHSAQFLEILANESFAVADMVSEIPVKSGGGAFTEDSFRSHKTSTQADPIHDAHKYGQILATNVVQLFRSAARSRKLSVALYAMRHAIFEIVEQFGLEAEFRRQNVFHEFAADVSSEEESIGKALAATALFRIKDARIIGNLDNVRDVMVRDIDRAKSAVQMMCSPTWPAAWKKRQDENKAIGDEFIKEMMTKESGPESGPKKVSKTAGKKPRRK